MGVRTEKPRARYEPAIGGVTFRTSVAALTIVIAAWLVSQRHGVSVVRVVLPVLVAWALSTYFTDKYRHKYPQRYLTYLLAAHAKAAVVTALGLACYCWLAPGTPVYEDLFLVAGVSAVADFLLELPRRRQDPNVVAGMAGLVSSSRSPDTSSRRKAFEVDKKELRSQLEKWENGKDLSGLFEFIVQHVADQHGDKATIRIIEADRLGDACTAPPTGVLVQLKPINYLKRLNLFLQDLVVALPVGSYFVCGYRPLEDELIEMRARHRGIRLALVYGLHFLWYRALPKVPLLDYLWSKGAFSWFDMLLSSVGAQRRRVISRAEMWGRLYYYGFEVLGERALGTNYWLVCRRDREQVHGRRPSFFLIAYLTKVGLDGKPLQVRKLRTMYPFSEFIQERVYRDHGLSNTGKFKNDFRVTDYGRFLRRYWLDEIPQVLDWLRGDVKLVGLRATSPQFLSLYPTAFYDLYIQTKPGLIPPIFDEGINGFDDIVKIEMKYLESYRESPITTDLRYFFETLHDIVVRRVRSK